MKNPISLCCVALACAGAGVAKTIPNYASANLVLGQPDYVSSNGPATTAQTFNLPVCIAVDSTSGKVFVCDRGNNRVLRFPDAASLSNGDAAEAVFGQPNLTSNSISSGTNGFHKPEGIWIDNSGRLWVADGENNRVLRFDSASSANSFPNASQVIGQPDFNITNSPALSQTGMDYPTMVCVDKNDRLWVCDSDNQRVLRFNSISSDGNGPAADGVLCQADFISKNTGTGISAKGIADATGICVSDDGSLFVVDSAANRVLRFDNAAHRANGAAANAVFGQNDFKSFNGSVGATSLFSPFGVCIGSDGALWVAEYSNARVVRFDDAVNRTNGAAADGLVGQNNFGSNSPGCSRRDTGGIYSHPAIDANGRLWVPDYANNRVLRFPPDTIRPLLKVTTNVPAATSASSITIKGTASDQYGIDKVLFKRGSNSWQKATGTTSWEFTVSLIQGDNTIRIEAVDKVGNHSLPEVFVIHRN